MEKSFNSTTEERALGCQGEEKSPGNPAEKEKQDHTEKGEGEGHPAGQAAHCEEGDGHQHSSLSMPLVAPHDALPGHRENGLN